MKLIDRYVATTFLKNYLLAFLVLVGMYVVMDMIFNFDELVEVAARTQQRADAGAAPSAARKIADASAAAAATSQSSPSPANVAPGAETVWFFLSYVADFYFYQVLLYFVHLSGIIPVVAASFTLMRMVRFNELSALLSSGVPLLRISMPVIIVGLLLNGLSWADQEMVIPQFIPKITRKHDYGADPDAKWFPISAMRDESGAKLFAGRYYPAADPPYMAFMSLVRVDENDQPVSHIKADRATWQAPSDGRPGRWLLTNGAEDINLSPRQPLAVRTIPRDEYPSGTEKSSITPEEIQLYRSGDFVDLLSTRRINELLQRPRSYGQTALLRVKHTRGPAQIMLNMTLLLLAIASVLTREPRQLKAAASWCVGLCGACLTVAFIGQELAGRPPVGAGAQLLRQWPALMAWLPVFVFLPLSVWLLDRVKT